MEYPRKESKNRVLKYTGCFVVLVLTSVALHSRSSVLLLNGIESSSDDEDCAATGPRRPNWASRKSMISAISEFSKIYERRPFEKNPQGMRFDHSFGFWYILRSLRPIPSVVIESGARWGHTTWLIREALPSALIISISPDKPKITVNNVLYMNGDNFIDFGNVSWTTTGIDIKNAVVLFDDHQGADIRIFNQGKKAGFRRFIYDDNYHYLSGDNLSMKWLCEIKRKSEWPGFARRNINKFFEPQTWDQHMKQVNLVQKEMKYYYEFPPVFYPKKYASKPLLWKKNQFFDLVGPIANDSFHWAAYFFICYVELH